jgi:acetyl esterase/lipase
MGEAQTKINAFVLGCVFLGLPGARPVSKSANCYAAEVQDDKVAVPSQPLQPSQGPGSSDYFHDDVQVSKHGKGARQYWIFTPSDPVPEAAPVIVFLHGWASMEPQAYSAWIRHLVRRGNIVIYPRYQEGFGTLPNSFVDHAVSAIHDATARLVSAGTIRPQLDRLAFVGHSMGAIMSANIAQNAGRYDLPAPRCLFLAEPAFEPILSRYDQIPLDTLLVVVVGSDVKRDAAAQRILTGTTRIPSSNKNYVALASDLHGSPPLISDHFAPCAADEVIQSTSKSLRNEWHGRTRDALDYFGYWKICDGLLDAAFHGVHREFAFGDTPEVRFMGKWSDGIPVEPAIVLPISDATDAERH